MPQHWQALMTGDQSRGPKVTRFEVGSGIHSGQKGEGWVYRLYFD
jgi:hypothetical protein